ncbi:MAG: Gfo/Idh/MocA family oxidoreductase [Candidatus Omnitrophota bacterium]
MADKKKTNRREFLAQTAKTASLGAAAFQIVPHTVFAAPNRPAPSDSLVLGHIGIGGRGESFLRPGWSRFLCDVDSNRLARAVKRVSGDDEDLRKQVKTFNDYRELLDQKEIDAVFIASPDHWHALHCIHACEAGKDVYVEKPACKTIEEGRAMVAAAERYARIVQVGSQGRSQEGAYHGNKYIANGQIGTVREVRCWHYPTPSGDWKTPNSDPPTELDYEKWVGPARWIPYNRDRTHGSFRWMQFTGAGQIRDRGAHVMSVALWVMNGDATGPVTVEAHGDPHHKGIYDSPVFMNIAYEFKNPDWTLIWAQPGEPHEAGFRWVRGSYGANYIGDKGNLIITYGDTGETDTEQKAKDFEVPADGVQVFHSPGHTENFIDCIKTREKPIMHIEAGHRVATLCILGNLSYNLGRKLEWDPVNECVKNDDEANRLLSNPGRGEWHI